MIGMTSSLSLAATVMSTAPLCTGASPAATRLLPGAGGEQVLRGIHGVRVARVDARTLDVLRDPGDERVGAVGHGVDLDLLAAQVLIDEHAAGAGLERGVEVTLEVVGRVDDLHGATAEHVRRAYEHRVPDPGRDAEGLRQRCR